MAGRARFRRGDRVLRPAEFRRIFRAGQRNGGRLFLLIGVASRRESDRLGLAVGRAVGGAVDRNRVKRLLRECFRRSRRAPREGKGLDLVLVARKEIVGAGLTEIESEYRDRLARLARRATIPSTGAAAGD